MRSLVAKAMCVAALLAAASQAHAQDGQSLVRVLDRTTADGQTTTSTFAVPTTPGRSNDRWFVTVARESTQARGTVTLNGATLLDERAFQGTSALLLRVEVQPALANTLITASRSGALQVLVDGVVADAPGAPLGPHVLFMRLFDDRFGPTGGASTDVTVTSPATAGLFTLRLTNEGAATAQVDWNGAPALGPGQVTPRVAGVETAVDVALTNALSVRVMGSPQGRARLEVEGFVVDPAPPTIGIAPSDDAWVSLSRPLEITYTDDVSGVDLSTLSILVNGVECRERFLVGAAGATGQLSELPVVEGVNRVQVRLRDLATNLGGADAVFLLDLTPPELSLSPRQGDAFGSTEVAFVATYTDVGAGLDEATFRVRLDGQDVSGAFGVSGGEARAELTLTEGTHVVEVEISDAAGLRTVTSATFVVDLTPPSITFLSPAPGTVTGGRDEVVFAFTDDLAQVDVETLRLEGNGVDGSAALVVDAALGEARVRLGAIEGLGTGLLTLLATVADRAGNTGQATLTLDHDGTPPTLVLDPPADPPVRGRQSPTPLRVFFADDTALAPGTLRVLLDGQEITSQLTVTDASAEGTFTLTQGLHVLRAEVEDVGGSLGVASATFHVDDVAPTVTISAPDCVGPTDEIVVRAVDHESGLGAAIQVLANGVDVSAYAIRDVGVATLDLGAIPPDLLSEGPLLLEGVVEDRAANVGRGSVTTSYDRTGPVVSTAPSQGTATDDETPTLVVTWTDAGCGAAPSTFSATVDGQTVLFSVAADRAEATLPLADGEHTLAVVLSDDVGNRTEHTSTFTVNASAVAFELSLEPGDPSAVMIHTENDLVLRAVTLSGRTATTYAGTVMIDVSDGLPPLDGTVATFVPGDQGVLTIPRLAFFRSAGLLTVSARSLQGDLAGTLQVEVVLDGPVITSDLPAATNAGSIDVEGVSFPGQVVLLVINGQVVAQTIAGPNGAYRFEGVVLGDGEHQIAVTSVDPRTGLPRTSPVFTVVVDRDAPVAPEITSPVADTIVANLLTVRGTAEPGSLVTIREGTTSLGSALAPGGAFVVAIRLTSGAHDLVALATDAAGSTSAASRSVHVVTGASPIWGRVLDGDAHPPQPLTGLSVRLSPQDGAPALVATTDANGRFMFADAPAGRGILSINAPRQSGFARLDLPTLAFLDRAQAFPSLVLPRITAELEVALPVDGQGVVAADMFVENPRVAGARVTVLGGTRVSGEGAPRLAIRPVDPAHSPLPFPRAFRPRTLWEISPTGLTFSPPLSLRLPNLGRLRPGTVLPLIGFKAARGGWVELGLATVDATGAFLETGPILSDFSLVGVTSPGELLSTQVELRLTTTTGAPLDGASVTLDGQPLAAQGAGLYRSEPLLLPRGRPLRALATLELADGAATLVGESRPALATAGTTSLPDLVLGVAVSAGITSGGGQSEDPAVSINSPASNGEPCVSADARAYAGFLNLFFAEPDAPPFVAVSEVPATAANAPETARFVPFGFDVSDPNAGTVDVVSVEYSLDGGATFVTADVVQGDPAALLSSPIAGKRHLLLWDAQGLNGVGLVDLAQVVLRATVRDPEGHAWTSAPSEPFFLRTGAVVVAPSPVDFGEVDRPALLSRTVTVTNDPSSQVVIEIRSLALTGADAARFAIATTSLPRTLQPSESLTFDVTFDGSAPEGSYAATLEVGTSVPGSPLRVDLHAASASPTAVLSTTQVDLGSVRVGTPDAEAVITVQNTSARRALVVSAASVLGDPAFSSDLALPLTVPAGGAATFRALFAPRAPGDATATLQLTTNDPDALSIAIALEGRGERPILRVDPSTVPFGSVLVGTGTTRTVLIANDRPGNLDLVVSAITLADGAAGTYSLVAPVTSFVVAPGSSATIEVRFAPTPGAKSGRLVIESDDPDAPTVSVDLVGTGVETLATLAPDPFDYGLRRRGVPVEQEFLIRNAAGATAPLTVTAITGPSTAAFTLLRDEATGRTLAPGETATFAVRFEATAIGLATDSVVVSFAEGAPIEAELSGSAGEPDVVVTPLAIDVGDVGVGTQVTRTVAVENLASATYPLTVASLVAPAGSGVFEITSAIAPGRRIEPGEVVSFHVTFRPTTADAAPITDLVSVASDDPDQPSVDVALAGRGTRPFVDVDPSSVDFGTIADRTTRERPLTIANVAPANVPLQVLAVELTDDGAGAFSLDVASVVSALSPGGSTSALVRYAPRPGTSTGQLLVRTDDPDAPELTITLSARGELPVAVVPDALAFGLRRVGDGVTLALAIENDASATADLAARVITHDDGGQGAFGLGASEIDVVVRPGQTASVDVLFSAPADRPFQGTLWITTNDLLRPTIDVALSGSAGHPRLEVLEAVDLGGVRVALSTETDLAVRNAASATFPLSLSEIALVDSADGVFALVQPTLPATLQPDTGVTARVTFSPRALEDYRGVVRVESSDGPPREVELRGRGALPDLVLASLVTFPLTRVGREAPLSVRIGNASPDLPLHVSAASVTGSSFRLVAPFPVNGLLVPAGGEVLLAVGFAPTGDGPFSGELALSTDDPRRSTATVQLSGTGTFGALELTLDPGPAPGETTIQAGSLHALRVRAVDAAASTDVTFTGLVELTASDPASPLDGLVLLFTEDDDGVVTVPHLPAFLAPGAHTLRASLLLPETTPQLGTLDVEVTPAERGQAYVVLPPTTGVWALGAELEARLFVDCGPNDGDPVTLDDTLGMYDVRLLLDPYALEVVEVTGGPVLGAPSFRWLGSELRLMHLSDTGTLTFPAGPNPAATGLVHLATVRLRVRATAPSGPTPIHLAIDALATAEAAEPELSPLGRPGSRLGTTVGSVRIAGDRSPDALAALGALPRAREAVLAPLQEAGPVQVVFSRALDPDTLASVRLVRVVDGSDVDVAGTASQGSSSALLAFTPELPLIPGDYVLKVAGDVAGVDAALPGPIDLPFRVGPVDTPRPADLDRDGEITITDVALRRDRVVGRSAGAVPDFPPLFLDGLGSIVVPEGQSKTILLRVVDLEGADVLLSPEGLPSFVRLTRLAEELFELTIDPQGAGGGGTFQLSATAGGDTTDGDLTIVIENVNTPPRLVLVEPTSGPFVIKEGESFTLVLEAIDPDLRDVSPFTDTVEFSVTSPSIRNLSGPALSGAHQERATFTFEPDHTQAGIHELEVEAKDGKGEKATFTASLDVREVNQRPELVAIAPVNTTTVVQPGDTIAIEFEATDADEGDQVEVHLQGSGERDLERAVQLGQLRLLSRESSAGRLRLLVQVLEPIPQALTLYAVASDGKSVSDSAVRVAVSAMTVTSAYSVLNDDRMVPVQKRANPAAPFYSQGFAVRLNTGGRFLKGSTYTFPTEKVWFEVPGTGQIATNVVTPVNWASGGGVSLSLGQINLTDLTFSDDNTATFDLAVETQEKTAAGIPVVRRTPVVFVRDGLHDFNVSMHAAHTHRTLYYSQYTGFPPGTYDIDAHATTTFETASAGPHVLRALLQVSASGYANGVVNSVEVRVDGQAIYTLDSSFEVNRTVPAGWTGPWYGNGAVSRILDETILLTAGTHTLEIRARGTGTLPDPYGVSEWFAEAGFGVSLTGLGAYDGKNYSYATLLVPRPELTLVSVDPIPGTNDTLACARVRVDNPHLVQGFEARPVNGVDGQVLHYAVVQPAPEDRRASVEVDLLLGLATSKDRILIAARYLTGTTFGTTTVFTEPPIEILTPLEAEPGRARLTDRGFFRPQLAAGTGTVVLEPSFYASILPEGQRAEEQVIASNPYALYYAHAITGIDPDDVPTWGFVNLPGRDTPLQPVPLVDGVAGALAGTSLRRNDRKLTSQYRISPPIFFVYRAQPAGSLMPIQVLPDRIVVSIGVEGFDGEFDVIPRTFPLPSLLDEGFSVRHELLNQGTPTNQFGTRSQTLISPGLLRLSHDHDTNTLEPQGLLDGSLVECDDVIQAWFPFPSEEGSYTLYLDDGDGAPLVALSVSDRPDEWIQEYSVHELLVSYPEELTPGQHRVRLYPTLSSVDAPPQGPPLFEATFELILSNRALVFKTDVNHPAPDCDGATPGDPEQPRVVQGDVPFGDMDSPATSKSGSTVLHATGEEILERVDLEIPGVGMNFVFSRTYRSKVKFNGPLGHNWDFNWNDGLHLDDDGNIERQNGHGRKVVWKKLGGGLFETPPGHFSRLELVGDRYVLSEPDGMTRVYSLRGFLLQILDRNNNALTVHYDERTDLITKIVDTVGRSIFFEYERLLDTKSKTLAWRLRKIRDFGGRVVEYVYDKGGLGNLEEVKAPSVPGQDGRSERYTYSNDVDEDLNHNLTEVYGATNTTTPKQRIRYGVSRANPLTFDRVIEETEGDESSGGVRKFTYEDGSDPLYGTRALLEVTVEEPNGNVHAHLIDADPNQEEDAPPRTHHEIWVRIMTRRGLDKQDTPPLRLGEPNFYETRSFFTPDGLPLARVRPLGNRELYTYETLGDRSRQSNLIELVRFGGGERLVTKYTYEPRFNQLASVTDARGLATNFAAPLPGGDPVARYTAKNIYDTAGNLLRVDHPSVTLESGAVEEVFTLFRWTAAGQLEEVTDSEGTVTRHEYDSFGNLHATTVDPSGLALRTEYTHDTFGNVTAVVNPGGTKTTFVVNALNQVTTVVRGDGSPDPATGLETHFVYDADGRVTATYEESPTGQQLERKHTYDILGNLLERDVELEDGSRQKTTYAYDPSNLLILVTSPLGNQTVMEYDERNLPFKVTRGANDATFSSTVQIDYDPNGNRTRVLDGLTNATTFTYDAHDRLKTQRDAEGTETVFTYDPVGNVVKAVTTGRPAPGVSPVALSSVLVDHDELKRPFRTTEQLLDDDGNTTAKVLTHTLFDTLSRPKEVTVAEAIGTGAEVVRRRTELTYDRASRPTLTVDNAGDRGNVRTGNRTERKYDANGNPTLVKVLEIAPDTLVAAQAFTSTYVFDDLDRVTKATDPAGDATLFEYDRRSHLARRVDPEGSVARWVHDGLDRLVDQIRELKRPPGEGPPVGITVSFAYDADGRVASIKDANGHVTEFGHDALDRQTSRKHADGGTYTFKHDEADNVVEATDPNGTRQTRTFDRLNRLATCSVLRGTGVEGAQAETYAYDGLSRLVRAASQTSATDVDECRWEYDSLSRVVKEIQNNRVVTSTYAPAGGRTGLTYPGGRTLSFTLDNLQRPTEIQEDSSTIASFRWAGPGLRQLRRWHGNNTLQTYLDDTRVLASGYDAVQRVVGLRVFAGVANPDVAPTTVPIVHRTYGYGAAGQRLSETRHDDEGLKDEYEYDSTYRTTLTKFDQGSSATRRALRSRSYTFDLAGNRTKDVETTQAVGMALPTVATRTFDSNTVHQYTKITQVESAEAVVRTHDRNGNLTDDGVRLFFYDFKDRLVRVARKMGNVPLVDYSYLADGRRVSKVVHGSFVRRSVWDGPQEIEEQEAGVTVATYVWAPGYVDDLLQFERAAGHPLGAATFYVHSDARSDVVAITDDEGTVVERRRYEDYGRVEVLGTPVGLEYGFQGRRLDPETGLLYFRARSYDAVTGRFLQRDPVWDANNVGNPHTFVGNNPATLNDPSGEILFAAVPVWMAVTAVVAAGGATAAGADYYAQSVTTAGFTAGTWDKSSTAFAGVFGAVTAPLSLVGGPVGGGVRNMIMVQALRATAGEIAGRALEKGIMAGVEAAGGGGEAERFDESEEAFDNCFLAGTNVETASRGGVAVEDVRVGDRIAPPPGHEGCADPRCGEVVRLFRNQTDQIVTITAVARPRAREHRASGSGDASGEDAEPPSANQTIRCTPGHPFFVAGRGWVLAGDLRAGDELEARGERVVVAAVEVRAERAETFNFEVTCHHTYRVSGAAGHPAVLVHNISRAALRALRKSIKNSLGTISKWGDHLEGLGVPKIAGMVDAHAHHIVFKGDFIGNPAMRRVLQKSRGILERHGIDWAAGKANLMWQTNAGHSLANAKRVLATLQRADRPGASQAQIVRALRRVGRRIANEVNQFE